MKKMIFALVVMFAMTMSVNAQSNDTSMFFKRIGCYLELDKNQIETVEISMTELKSPGLDMGNPASIISTPSSSSALATWIFSTVLSWHPGTCSPSRSVVSNM